MFVVVEESDLAESEKTLEKNSPESRSTQAAPLVSPVHERFKERFFLALIGSLRGPSSKCDSGSVRSVSSQSTELS